MATRSVSSLGGRPRKREVGPTDRDYIAFHVPAELGVRIRAAAAARRMSITDYMGELAAAEHGMTWESRTGTDPTQEALFAETG